MIKIKKTEGVGFEHASRGMRNPMNSWERSDSGHCGGDDHIGCANCACVGDHDKNQKMIELDLKHGYGIKPCGKKEFDNSFCVGYNDYDLMKRLANGGPVHAKFRRMIVVYLDITAPLYWWKEFDTYKVGTVANSCSTMHKIHEKEFTLYDFSCEYLTDKSIENLEDTINIMNEYRAEYVNYDISHFRIENDQIVDKEVIWWQMIQLLPTSYNQKRTIMLNYEVLVGMYRDRKNHKLDEWRKFCKWIESLPCSEIITGEKESEE